MQRMPREISEPEITKPVVLCDTHGNLNGPAIGWSRTPLMECNLSHHPLRKKRWNYWAITTPDFLFSVTVSDVDYLGMAFVYFMDFKTGSYLEKTITTPLGKGCTLGSSVFETASFVDRNNEISFIQGKSTTDLVVHCQDFGGSPLKTRIQVRYPRNHQTMSVVIPWNAHNFQYTSKHNCLPASGTIELGDTQYTCKEGASFACLDFGAGVWPYASFWNWSSFSGISQGHTIGINLGAGWTDGTGLTENNLTCDGKITKLSEDILFDYNPNDFMRTWRINTRNSDRVRLVFTPFFERKAKTDALILYSSVHQMFGRFTGMIRPEGGRTIPVKDIIGWAEDHHARW